MKNYGEEFGWEIGVDFPSWGNTEVYVKTISKGYLLKGETPKDAYNRVASSVANRLGKPELSSKFFSAIWNNHLCLATPVLANVGTDRGLPISCFGIDFTSLISIIFSGTDLIIAFGTIPLSLLSTICVVCAWLLNAIKTKNSKVNKDLISLRFVN